MMVPFIRLPASLSSFALLWSCLLFSALVHAQTPPITCGSCTISLPSLYDYTWSPILYESSTTIEVTVATLVYVIDPAGQTSTSTKLATNTETLNVTLPTTTNVATVTNVYSYDSAQSTALTSTALVTYPTPFVDYYGFYYLWTGAIYTSSACLTESFTGYKPPSHPLYPQPKTATPPVATDTLGYDYTLVRQYSSELPPGYNQQAFTSWYSAAFSDEGAVAQCTANNSWRAPPRSTSATITLTSLNASARSNHTSILTTIKPIVIASLSTTCFSRNLTTSTCFTITQNLTSIITATLSATGEPVVASTSQSPAAYSTIAFTETSASGLTHTSVKSLTATSTSHVSTNFGSKPTSSQVEPANKPSPSAPEDQSRPQTPAPTTSPFSNSPPTDGSGATTPHTEPTKPGSQPGVSPNQAPPYESHLTGKPSTYDPAPPFDTNGPSSRNEVGAGQTLTILTVSSFVRTTSSNGQLLTLTSEYPVTIIRTAETQAAQIPITSVIQATSGQVLVLPTTISSTLVTNGQTITTSFVDLFTSTATAGEQITIITNQASTDTGAVGTHVIAVPTTTVETATSGEVFSLSTNILTTITSGTNTYVTSIPTTTVFTATPGQLVTIATTTESTQTLATGTDTTGVPGASQPVGTGAGQANGGSRRTMEILPLLTPLILGIVVW